MKHPQEPTLSQGHIKWPWLFLSCISLGIGFLYLSVVDIAAPVQFTQNSTEQQP
ncbi:MAG: hypothetical protein AAGF93_07375 [Cyanobacteria bacterium P01_H01_bin.105]